MHAQRFGACASRRALTARSPSPSRRAHAGPCDAPANAIVAENCLPGDSADTWDVSGAGDPSIQGFATDISVNRGQTVLFKIDTDSTNYRLDIYRMGYYGGMGARRVATVQPRRRLPQTQPACLEDSGDRADRLRQLGGLGVLGGAGERHVGHLLRARARGPQDGRAATSSSSCATTAAAPRSSSRPPTPPGRPTTSTAATASTSARPHGRAYKVSYNRPFTTRGPTPEDWVFNAEYPMVRWLEANGYDVSYTPASTPTAAAPSPRAPGVHVGRPRRVLVGRPARQRRGGARRRRPPRLLQRQRGVLEDALGEQHRRLGYAVPHAGHYKETHANAKIDPLPNVWTGTWRDPRFSPPADGGRPENALTGTIFTVNCCSDAITVPAADGSMRFWRNTTVATLGARADGDAAPETLGYEWDEDLDNGFRPAGPDSALDHHAHGAAAFLDYGSNYGTGTATHP